jgi:hypothetical protein
LSQSLVRFCVPAPQVTLQVEVEVQAPQFPFSKFSTHRYIWKTCFITYISLFSFWQLSVPVFILAIISPCFHFGNYQSHK